MTRILTPANYTIEELDTVPTKVLNRWHTRMEDDREKYESTALYLTLKSTERYKQVFTVASHATYKRMRQTPSISSTEEMRFLHDTMVDNITNIEREEFNEYVEILKYVYTYFELDCFICKYFRFFSVLIDPNGVYENPEDHGFLSLESFVERVRDDDATWTMSRLLADTVVDELKTI